MASERGEGATRGLLYRLLESVPAVNVDSGLNRESWMQAEDRRMGMVEMEGWMFQESEGTDSDGREPKTSEERVAQGDWTA